MDCKAFVDSQIAELPEGWECHESYRMETDYSITIISKRARCPEGSWNVDVYSKVSGIKKDRISFSETTKELAVSSGELNGGKMDSWIIETLNPWRDAESC